MTSAKDKEQRALMLGCGLAMAIVLFAVFAKFSTDAPSMNTVYENILEQKKVLEQMRIQLLKSVEMEQRAVMALTDRESEEYAQQSRAASKAVDQNLALLSPLVEAQPMPNEKPLLAEFATCWAELGAVDRVILQLAVENTNLKAAALSREKGAEILQRFERNLDALRELSRETANASRAAELASRAMIASLKIYALHGPHIIETASDTMDQYERRIHEHANEVAQALDALNGIVAADHRERVSQAQATFAEFAALTAQVVELSRQNSNIKSLELSMGRKRSIAAQCDEILAALQETVQNKPFKATK